MNNNRLAEICYSIELFLQKIDKININLFNFKDVLIHNTLPTDEALKKLTIVSELLNDPSIATNYSYYLKRAEERIEAFSKEDSEITQLIAVSGNLKHDLTELNNEIGLSPTHDNPLYLLCTKLNNFIEQHFNYWLSDYLVDWQNFEQRNSGCCLAKTQSYCGKLVYADPTVQLAYFNFVCARVEIHNKYFALYTTHFAPVHSQLPYPYDERLYTIYNIYRPHWC